MTIKQKVVTALILFAIAVGITALADFRDKHQSAPHYSSASRTYTQILDVPDMFHGPLEPTEELVTMQIPVFPDHAEPELKLQPPPDAVVYAAQAAIPTSQYVDLPIPALTDDELEHVFNVVGIPANLHPWFKEIIWCESGNLPGNVGYAGAFLGLLQIHDDWFIRYPQFPLSAWFDPINNVAMGWYIFTVSGPSQWQCTSGNPTR